MSGFLVPGLVLAGALALYLLARFVRRPQQGLYLTIFASAILITPELPVVREKLTATEFLVALTWMALLLRAAGGRVRRAPLSSSQRTSLILGGAFSIWAVVSFALNMIEGADPRAVAAGAVETASFVYGYLMFATVVWMVDDWPDLWGCLLAWFAGAAVVAAFGVWAFIGGAPAWTYDDFTGRISSTLRTENQVPMFLMPIIGALGFWAVQRRAGQAGRIGAVVLLAGVLLTVAGTGSRTAFGMAVLAIIGIAWLGLLEAPRRGFNKGLTFNLALALVAAMGVYVALALVGYQGDYALGKTPAWQRPVVMLYDWVRGERALDETRPAQIEQAWRYFWDQPVIGTGPKLYGYEYRMAEVHNTYVGVMLQMGIVGLMLLAAWQVHVLLLGWRTGRRLRVPFQRLMVLSLVVGMVLLMVYGLTMFGLRQRNLWLLAGLIVAAHSLRLREVAAQRARQGAGSAQGPPAVGGWGGEPA